MSKPTSAAPPPLRGAVAVLFAGLVANAMGHSFVLVVLPALGRQLGFGDVQTGLLLSLSALALTLSAPLWGTLCESWGRRRVLLIGLTAAAVFPAVLAVLVDLRLSLALSATLAFTLLLGLRLPQAVVAGGVMPAAQAFLADVTSADRRAGGMGLMGAAFGIGSIAGAALAFGLGGAGVTVALWGIAGVIGAALILLWRALPEPPRAAADPGLPVGRVVLSRVWPFLGITACGLAVYGLLQQVTALRLQDGFGLTPDPSIRMAGAVMMATMAAMIVTQGLLVRKLAWSPAQLLRVGSAIALLSMGLAVLAPSVPVLVFAMAGVGASLGLVLPGNLASLSLRTGAGAQAKAAGINGLAQGVGMASGPLLGAGLHQISPTTPYIAAAGVLIVLLVLAWGATRASCSPDALLRSPSDRDDASDSHTDGPPLSEETPS